MELFNMLRAVQIRGDRTIDVRLIYAEITKVLEQTKLVRGVTM